jgi:hypothetical protein
MLFQQSLNKPLLITIPPGYFFAVAGLIHSLFLEATGTVGVGGMARSSTSALAQRSKVGEFSLSWLEVIWAELVRKDWMYIVGSRAYKRNRQHKQKHITQQKESNKWQQNAHWACLLCRVLPWSNLAQPRHKPDGKISHGFGRQPSHQSNLLKSPRGPYQNQIPLTIDFKNKPKSGIRSFPLKEI